MTEPAPSGLRGAGIVLGLIFGVSTLLALYMFSRYSQTLSYVRSTIGDIDNGVMPQVEFPWASAELTPEECVDATLEWARQCTGIKSMCDMYVDRYMALCLESGDRNSFCHAIEGFTGTTEFGVPECRARGVLRNVDKEACAMAYRTVDGFCEVTRRRAARAAEAQSDGSGS
jgi:hypothetical protein